MTQQPGAWGRIADYSDAYWLLALFSSNFVRTRYPYEIYKPGLSGLTSFAWAQSGCTAARRLKKRLSNLRNELYGFIHALSAFASARADA